MNGKLVAVCVLVISLTMIRTNIGMALSTLCKPGVVDEMPPNIRKVCLALENSDQLASAFKSYITNEAACMSDTINLYH